MTSTRKASLVQARGENTHRKMLRVAEQLFASQGYAKTSMSQISRRVGVTKAALYYHFASKEDLLLEIHEGLLDFADIDDQLEAEMPPPEILEELFRRFIAAVDRQPEQFAMQVRDLPIMPASLRKRIRASRDRLGSGIQRTVERGIETGDFVPLGNPETLVMSLVGMFWSYVLARTNEDGPDAAEVGESLIRLALRGLSAR